jgi:hypothetical protein
LPPSIPRRKQSQIAHAVNKPDVTRTAQRPEPSWSLSKSRYCNIGLGHQQPVVQIRSFYFHLVSCDRDARRFAPVERSDNDRLRRTRNSRDIYIDTVGIKISDAWFAAWLDQTAQLFFAGNEHSSTISSSKLELLTSLGTRL